jgi:C_GCAxxG_C_C family probable redox protein
LQAYYGIANEDIWRLATGLGAGLSRRQDVCGALTGGVVACGLITGRQRASEPADRIALREETYARVQALTRAFEERFSTLACKAMVDCDFGTPDGRQAFKNRGQMKSVCEPAVRLAMATVVTLCDQAPASTSSGA